MPLFIIEKNLSEIDLVKPELLSFEIAKNNQAIRYLQSIGENIRWLKSYVAENKNFCIYEADSLVHIKNYAILCGFPDVRITKIANQISPETIVYGY